MNYLINIELKELGEIAMGTPKYGVVIETSSGTFNLFRDRAIIIGSGDHSQHIVESNCGRYLLLRNSMDEYILDMKENKITLYQVSIRGNNGEWIYERAIMGKETRSISTFNKHYYIQYPFCTEREFDEVFLTYKKLRMNQVEVAVNLIS